jgi:DNA polymerase-1
VLNTTRRADQRTITTTDVAANYHVQPTQWCDYRALIGDPSDNIPGIRGIGPKTASTLLASGRRLDDLHTDGRLTGRAGAAIQRQWDELTTWRALITLSRDIRVNPRLRQQATPLPLAQEIIGELGLWAAKPADHEVPG